MFYYNEIVLSDYLKQCIADFITLDVIFSSCKKKKIAVIFYFFFLPFYQLHTLRGTKLSPELSHCLRIFFSFPTKTPNFFVLFLYFLFFSKDYIMGIYKK